MGFAPEGADRIAKSIAKSLKRSAEATRGAKARLSPPHSDA